MKSEAEYFAFVGDSVPTCSHQWAHQVGTGKVNENSLVPTVPIVPTEKRESQPVAAAQDTDAFEDRAAIIHEAHTVALDAAGQKLDAPIFTLTQEQAETFAAQEQGHADSDSLHGEVVARWAAEIERLARLKAVSPDGAQALISARAFISDGWALQAVRLGWDEAEIFGVCPRAPWVRLDRKGVAFGGGVQAVTAEAVTYIGGMRRFRANVNNDNGAVPIWELPDPEAQNVETHQNKQ